MQIPSFPTVVAGAEVSEAAQSTVDQPPRVARDFARLLAGSVVGGDPDVSAAIEEGAPQAAVGAGLPFSAVVIEFARRMPEGPAAPPAPPDDLSADVFEPGPGLAEPSQTQVQSVRDSLGAQTARNEPRRLTDEAQNRQTPPVLPPTLKARHVEPPADTPQPESRPSNGQGVQAEQPAASGAKNVVAWNALGPVRLHPLSSDAPPVPWNVSAESAVALPRGHADAQSMPPEHAKASGLAQALAPEHAKALGLARAPGIVGAKALPETAVAKGIRETPLAPAAGGATPEEGRLPTPAPVQGMPLLTNAGIASDGGREGQGGKSQDRPTGKIETQRADPAREKPTQPAFVGAQSPEATADDIAASRPAESQISGPSGNPAHPAAPVSGSTTASGLGQATIQQLAVAIRRSEGGEIEIALEPEELGKVRLTIGPHDTRVTVSVFVERPETLDLIRRHIDALTSDLRQQGYTEVALDFAQNRGQQGNKSLPDLPAQAAPSEDTAPAETGKITSHPSLRVGGLDLRI
jgi:flagellar hook-length control protein FliK